MVPVRRCGLVTEVRGSSGLTPPSEQRAPPSKSLTVNFPSGVQISAWPEARYQGEVLLVLHFDGSKFVSDAAEKFQRFRSKITLLGQRTQVVDP